MLFIPFDSTRETTNIDHMHMWEIVGGDEEARSLPYLAKAQECKTSKEYEQEFNRACPEFTRAVYQNAGTCSASCEQWWINFANSGSDSKCYFAYRSQASPLINAVSRRLGRSDGQTRTQNDLTFIVR